MWVFTLNFQSRYECIIVDNSTLCSACAAQFNCTVMEQKVFDDILQDNKWNFGPNNVAKLREVQAYLKTKLKNIPNAAKVVLPAWGGTVDDFLRCQI